MGGRVHARPPLNPGEIRQGQAPQGNPGRRLPPRHERDGHPDADPQGGRGRGTADGLESAQHPGQRRGGAGQELRNSRLRHQGRGQSDLLPAHQSSPRRPSPDHHGRRGRPRLDHPLQAPGPPQGRHRGDRRDDDGGHPPQEHGPPQGPRVPDHRRQRRRHQAPLRQPLRDGPEHDRRNPAGDQRPAGRTLLRRRRLRLVRPRARPAGPGPGAPRSS